ncbi:MAG: GWxTD domain-containing protein [candidate division KSB1 bacterium]|nr:GWxTD domain-containing protein [candidate division KSB1 bacterium]
MRVHSAYSLVMFVWLVAHSFAQVSFKNEAQRQAAFRCILSEELVRIYDQIFDPELKLNWEQKYWKLLDPTPETDENEIYLQFIDRFRYAQRHFSNSVGPLFLDDRGKYYLKYGEPDDRVISSGVGKAYRDNETWAYYQYNLFIDFVDQLGFGYREVPSLLDAITSGPSNLKIRYAADLYRERSSLHQRYYLFGAIADEYSGLSSESKFYQLSRELSNDKNLALETAPAVDFKFSYKKQRLDAQMECATFRGEEQFSRVECYYSFPLRQLKFEPGQQFPLECLVNKSFVVFDQNFEKILQREENIQVVAEQPAEIEKRVYLNQHIEQLPPGFYHIVLKLESNSSNRLAILRGQLRVKDFRSDTLTISDIQLSTQIREGISQQRYLKPNNILVVPYAWNVLRRTTPCYIYFELYNLTLSDQGITRFRIEYELQTVSEPSSSPLDVATQFISHLVRGDKSEQKIGSSFESEGKAEFQQIYLLLDFSTFPPGSCILKIWATDLVSGGVATAMKRLIIN